MTAFACEADWKPPAMENTNSQTSARFSWETLIRIALFNLGVFTLVTIVWQGAALYLVDAYDLEIDMPYVTFMGASFYFWLPVQLLFNLIRAMLLAGKRPTATFAHLITIFALPFIAPPLIFVTYFLYIFLIFNWLH